MDNWNDDFDVMEEQTGSARMDFDSLLHACEGDTLHFEEHNALDDDPLERPPMV